MSRQREAHMKKTIEIVKKFWNDRPCNIRHGTDAVGSREFFEQVEARKYFVEPHILPFSEFDKWKEKKFSKLVVDWEPQVSHLRKPALITAESSFQKCLLNWRASDSNFWV